MNLKEEFKKERTRIISKMLDNPDKDGIYPTTRCFTELDKLFEDYIEHCRKETKLVPTTLKIFGRDVPVNQLECCKVGPITNENYCPNCGAKIIKEGGSNE